MVDKGSAPVSYMRAGWFSAITPLLGLILNGILLFGCSRCPSSSSPCGDTCLSSGAQCGGCNSPCGSGQLCVNSQCLTTQVATLSYNVDSAQYSLALDRIVIASDSDAAVHVYDPRTNDDTRIPLPASIPLPSADRGDQLRLALAPDGLRAVIVSLSSWIVYVDLANATILGQFSSPNPDAKLSDVAVGSDGYAYVLWTGGGWSLDLATGAFASIALDSTIEANFTSFMASSPDGARLYTINSYYQMATVPLAGGRIGPSLMATEPTCGAPWVSRDGTRVFTSCGPTYESPTATPDGGVFPSGPMLAVASPSVSVTPTPAVWGLDDPSSGSPVAAIGVDPGANVDAPDAAVDLALYDPGTLALQGTVPFPLLVSGGVTSPSFAQFVFYDASGTTRFELVAAGTFPNAVWGVASF
jgi:hypothetical protein